MPDRQPTEDHFLGALLGMAIGDALGRPRKGRTAEEIGEVTGYLPVEDEEGRSGAEISNNTEVALCLVESMTTNDGQLDPININVRLGFLAKGPSGEVMSAVTKAGLEYASDHDGLVAEDGDDPTELAVATRGVPVGLMHAIGGFDQGQFDTDCEIASRLTHRGPAQSELLRSVALAVRQASRMDAVCGVNPAIQEIADLALGGDVFEQGVFQTVAQGGEADSRGAIAGAIAGARFGASGIPQQLIDDLDARIYLSLAAPWFYRIAQRRAGLVIDLRQIGG